MATSQASLRLFERLKEMTHCRTNVICKYPQTEVGDFHALNSKGIAESAGLSLKYTRKLLWELIDAGYMAKFSAGYSEKFIINIYKYYAGKHEPYPFLQSVFSAWKEDCGK